MGMDFFWSSTTEEPENMSVCTYICILHASESSYYVVSNHQIVNKSGSKKSTSIVGLV